MLGALLGTKGGVENVTGGSCHHPLPSDLFFLVAHPVGALSLSELGLTLDHHLCFSSSFGGKIVSKNMGHGGGETWI